MIQYQILQIDIMRIVYKTVKRITNEILGVKGLNETGINYQHVRDLGNRIGQQHVHTWENYDTLCNIP